MIPLSERKVIVTGGPTREWLDPVRFISNASSGRMGIALADASFKRSGKTIFIHGPMDTSLTDNRPYKTISVEATSDMLRAVLNELEDACVLIMAAAPADYAPVQKFSDKIKKGAADLMVNFKRTPDILMEVSSRVEGGKYAGAVLVGFAAETTNTEIYARKKLEEKNLDMICLNDLSKKGAGFNIETNIITIFDRTGARVDLPLLAKSDAAEKILDRVEFLIAN